MALTKIQGQNIANSAISTNKVDSNFTATYATYAAVAANLTPRITTVNVANSSYTVLDDVAVNTSGGYLVITGANFQSGAIVTIENSQATSTTYVNDTTLRAQVAAKNAGSYVVYVQNPDGGTAIRVNGVTFSNTPVWGTAATLSNQAANTAFAVSISANSDSNVTYSNTTSLPAGTTLLANGLFYGTVTIGAETVYSFDVRATDAELQDTPRTFSLTVTVTPVRKLFSFGAGNDGALALNDTTSRSSPVQVGTATTWSVIDGGFYHALGIKSDGTLWSWGKNANGQLGLGDVIPRSSPTQIGALTDWSKIACGRIHSFAIRTNNSLYAWGNNSGDQLGVDLTGTQKSSPVQMGGTANWALITTAAYSAFGVKTDGTAWVWGQNAQSQLGLSNTAIKASPTQLGTDTDWSKIYPYYNGTFGIKTDGSLWAWGLNNGGQLGLNNINNYNSPKQVGTNTNWSVVDGGEGYALALKTDGTIWSIGGFNSSGELGLNDTVRRSSPTQIGSSTNWRSISVGYNEMGAVKTDNTLWLWGSNTYGQLGQNERTNKSSPVQVSGTNWKDVYHGYFVTYGISS